MPLGAAPTMVRRIGISVAAVTTVISTAMLTPSTAMASSPAPAADHPQYIHLKNGENYEFTLKHKPQNRLVPFGWGEGRGYWVKVYGGDFLGHDRFWTVNVATGHWSVDGQQVYPVQLRYRPSQNMCMTVKDSPTSGAYLWQQPCSATYNDHAQLWLIKHSTSAPESYKLVPWNTRDRAKLVVGPQYPNSEDTWVTLQAPGRNNDWAITDEDGAPPHPGPGNPT
ncbi:MULTISPECIES: hypothetical protein [Streptomyces]|uniref:Ricin B lectin domain-containing protein n=1 Tax=Streptomyces lycii TaxID=2654337 RepID=A0ABQ7FQ05_9ACTN|nr:MULTISPECIES: hypothetical protein [Streptomyces]KAF4411011.1 hypothetical protein GCU69_00830 [Streptomyces lycii]PGH51373.1 hypothetical protein CRI70_07080 [Streptomyces sp. Ru87]